MKKLVLCLICLSMVALPAYAYIQTGHLPQHQTQLDANGNGESRDDVAAGGDNGGLRPGVEAEPVPVAATRPVPEPGTLALISMGLVALGASSHRRRGRRS